MKTLADKLLEAAPLEGHPAAFEHGSAFVIQARCANGQYVSSGGTLHPQLEYATVYQSLHGALTGARIAQRNGAYTDLVICPLEMHVGFPVRAVPPITA